ncbi:MAG: hypothetical protein Q8K96_14770 [Rubrivivax sp.]|nr:hypothetical protein [Rubrivivax sp.]
MSRSLHVVSRWNLSIWGRRFALPAPSSLRMEVCPPSLRTAPDSGWQRLMFWLMAPAPQDAAPSPSRLGGVREDFLGALADVAFEEAQALRDRIHQTHSLRDLWHLRAEVYRVVGVAHSQAEAEDRLAGLSRHFPTRSPRSQLAPL